MRYSTDKLKVIDLSDNSEVSWGRLVTEIPNLQAQSRILRSGLGKYTKTVVIEPNYICRDHRNLHSNYLSKRFSDSVSRCQRLHFFSAQGIDEQQLLLAPQECQSDYLGYSVIRPIPNVCLGRSVFDPGAMGLYDGKTSFCLRTNFNTHIFGNQFTVNGFPYMAQDGEAMLCAHVAAWSACRYLAARYSVYKEIYPFDIIGLAERSRGRTHPYRGLTYQDLALILSSFGCHPLITMLKKNSQQTHLNKEDFANVCSYVESGFPVLATWPKHAVTIIGHTVDFDRAVTPDEHGMVDSSDYWKQLILIDDNRFPYARLGYINDTDSSYLTDKEVRTINDLETAICPLPEKAFMPADRAREKLYKYIRQPSILTILNNTKTYDDEPFVCRMLMTTGTAYKEYRSRELLKESRGLDPLDALILSYQIPHFVWLMQIAPLSMYRKGKCFGEIIIDCTASRFESGLIAMRLGNRLTTELGEKVERHARKSFSLYRHNLGEEQV